MKGALRVISAAVTVLACAPAAASAAPPPALAPGPALYPKIAVQHDVPIVMRDGTKLFADVYRPATADGTPVATRLPVVLTQTPYNKNALGAAGNGGPGATISGPAPLLVTHGYVQVLVDVRGTGDSEGAWDSFGEQEQNDSLDIARWVAVQPWSDGRLALFGASYMGINQFFTAAQHPPGLKAMFPIIPAEDVYRDVTWHGGGVDASFIPFWLGLVTALKVLPPGYTAQDPVEAMKVLAGRGTAGLQFDTDALLSTATRDDLAFDGPFYRLRSPGRVAGQVTVPTFITGGWFDLFQRGEPRLYQELNLKPGRKQLLMGPWYHITAGHGLGAKGAPPPLDALALAWFDRWVKHIHNGVERFGPVTLYQLGADRWARARSWPRKDVTYGRLYLRHEISGSASSVHDGSLSSTAPSAAASDTMPANVLNGLCARSTVQWTAGLVPPGQPCETDNRSIERSGLTYTTTPFAHQLHISGPIDLHLIGATTAQDTNWIATVSDVSPGGKSTQMTAGWLMSSRRAVDRLRSTMTFGGQLVAPFHPFTRASLLPVNPGERERLDVEIFNTDAVFRPGHRLRLTLTSGDIPHVLATVPDALAQVGGVDTAFEDPADPSYLELPIVTPR